MQFRCILRAMVFLNFLFPILKPPYGALKKLYYDRRLDKQIQVMVEAECKLYSHRAETSQESFYFLVT